MLRDLPSPSRPLRTWASWARDFSNPSRPVFEASLPTASCRLLTLKPKKSDDNIARDRAGSAANYHVTFWLSPAWGDHKKLIHVDQNSFKCGPVWAACPRLRPPAGCPWLAQREKLVEVKQMDIHGAGRGARPCRGGWSGAVCPVAARSLGRLEGCATPCVGAPGGVHASSSPSSPGCRESQPLVTLGAVPVLAIG